MIDTLLVVNAGSSSIKFQLFEILPGYRLELKLKGRMEGIGTHPRLVAVNATGTVLADSGYEPGAVGGVPDALDQLDDWLLAQAGGVKPIAIGHRVVHGGSSFASPVLVDDDVVAKLDTLVSLAPLHQPNNLASIKFIRERRPSIPQVHRLPPTRARTRAGPGPRRCRPPRQRGVDVRDPGRTQR